MRKELIRKIRNFTLLYKGCQTITKIILFISSFLLLYVLVDYFLFLPTGIRILFFIFILGITLFVLAMTIGTKFNSAKEIEANFKIFNGRLFASLSHYEQKFGYSTELIDKLRKETYDLLKKTNLSSLIKKKIKPKINICAITIIAFTITLFTIPQSSLWLKRLFLPQNKLLELKLEPGDKKVIYGDSVKIKVYTQGLEPKKLYLVANDSTIPLHKEKEFSTLLTVTNDIKYYAKISDVVSDTHKLLVLIPPFIKELKIKYIYPEYTKISPYISTNPCIECLYGTQVEIFGRSNINLAAGEIIFSNKKLPIVVKEDKFNTKFMITKEDSYHISLVGENELYSKSNKKYKIRVWEDEYPKIEVLYPAQDIKMPVSMQIPIVFHTYDDYGISKISIVTNKRKQIIPMEITSDTTITYLWNLENISISPGDIIEYWIEVYDNDLIKGPKLTKSNVYKIYFPTVEEIYKEVAEKEEITIENMEKTVESLQYQTQKLEKLIEKGSFTNEDKEKIKEMIEKSKELSSKIKEIEKNLDAIFKKIENNWEFDADLSNKIEELNKLFQEVNLPALKEAIKKLEEAIKEKPELLSEALKNLKLTQEEIKKRIERTIALLKQIKQEQTLKSIITKLQELEEKQKDIKKRTEAKELLDKLAKEEEQIKKEMDKTTEDLNTLAEDMQNKELKGYTTELNNLSKKMSDISQKMQKGDKSLKLQQDVIDEIGNLSSKLNSFYQKMLTQRQNQITRELRKLQKELLILSFEEEDIKGNLLDRAFMQQTLIKGAKNIFRQLESIIEMTPFISNEALKYLNEAIKSMEEAKTHFENKNVKKAKKSQLKAMTEINTVIKKLMESEKSMQMASSCAGFQLLMQQLKNITSKQEGLNLLIQSLLPLNLTPAQMGEQLAKLIEEQQSLAQELEKISSGLKGKVLGDMAGVAEEMKKIAEQMQKGITEEILERQRRVLNHLLDAQKSIYTKKKTEKRISEPGKNFLTLPPIPEPKLITKRGISQKEIIEALKKEYPQEYEKLIKAYFRSISTE